MEYLNWLIENGEQFALWIESISGWVILICVVAGLIYLLRWLAVRHEAEAAERKRCELERAEQQARVAELHGDVRVVETKLEAERKQREISEGRIEVMLSRSDHRFEKLHSDVLRKIDEIKE